MSIQERKEEAKKTTKTVVEKKKTVSELFMEELDDQEKEIFIELKSILIDKCELLEFEAVNDDNLDDYAALITYIKNGIVSIAEDGIEMKLRRPINNSKGEFLTNSLTILFERNEARERGLTKNIKVSKKSLESQKEFTRASLTASFKSLLISGIPKMISVDNTRGIHNKDYMLLLTIYNFFRN